MRVKIGTDPFTGLDLTVSEEGLAHFNHEGCPICDRVRAASLKEEPDEVLDRRPVYSLRRG